jgi:hypothetical protein
LGLRSRRGACEDDASARAGAVTRGSNERRSAGGSDSPRRVE